MKKLIFLFCITIGLAQNNGIRSLNGSLNNSQRLTIDTTTSATFRWATSNGVHTLYLPYRIVNPSSGSFKWNVSGQTAKYDSLRLIAGSNVSLTQSGNTVTIATSGGGSVGNADSLGGYPASAWFLRSDTVGLKSRLLKNADSTSVRTFSDSLYGRKANTNIWSGTNYFTARDYHKSIKSDTMNGVYNHEVKDTSIVINGNFTTNFDGWSGTNWARSGTTALHTVGSTSPLVSVYAPEIHRIYRISFAVVGATAGTIYAKMGRDSTNTLPYNSTIFIDDVITRNTDVLTFVPSSDFDGAIDSITVKKVPSISSISPLNDNPSAIDSGHGTHIWTDISNDQRLTATKGLWINSFDRKPFSVNYNYITATNKFQHGLYVDQNGDVAIGATVGTDTLTADFNVFGTSKFHSANNPVIRIEGANSSSFYGLGYNASGGYLQMGTALPFTIYGATSGSATFGTTGGLTITGSTSLQALTTTTISGTTIAGTTGTFSGTIKTVASTAGAQAIGLINTNTAQSGLLYFAQVDNGSSPAYIQRFGSTHATTAEMFLINNTSTASTGFIRFQSGIASGKSFDWYANGNIRAQLDATGSLTLGTTAGTGTGTFFSGAITSSGKISADSSFTINERSTTPTVPTSNTQMHYYMKGDKIVWQINNAGTVRYYYFDATATADQSIIYSATAP